MKSREKRGKSLIYLSIFICLMFAFTLFVPISRAETVEDTETETEVNSENMSLEEKEEALRIAIEKEDKENIDKLTQELRDGYKSILEEKVQENFLSSEAQEKFNLITDNEKLDSYLKLKSRATDALGDSKTTWNTFKELINQIDQYEFPRLLSSDERELLNRLSEVKNSLPTVIEPNQTASEDYEDYKMIVAEIEEATGIYSQVPTQEYLEDLKSRLEDIYQKMLKHLEDGNINIKYTNSEGAEIKLFLLNRYMYPEKLLDEEVYYIPENVSIPLLVQFAKDDKNIDFRVEISGINENVIGVSPSNLSLYLGVKNYQFVQEGDKYVVDVKNATSGVSQSFFTINGLRGKFHEGFKLNIKAISGDVTNEINRSFLITKSGYDDSFKLIGIGDYNEENYKYPVIDAGDTDNENNVLDNKNIKTINILNVFSKSNKWIDRVIKNSSPSSIELERAKVVIYLPDFDGKYAEYLEENGISYIYDSDNGTLTLDLSLVNLEKNLFVDEDGNYFVGDIRLEKAQLKDVILKDSNGYSYIDDQGNSHQVTFENIQVFMDHPQYYIKSDRVYLKNEDGDSEVALIKDNKFTSLDGQTQLYFDNELEKFVEGKKSIEKKEDVILEYKDNFRIDNGIVFNKDGIANPQIREINGKHIVLVDKDNNKYYAGTLLPQEKRYIVRPSGLVTDDAAEFETLEHVIVDEDGKIVEVDVTQLEKVKIDDKLFVRIDGKAYPYFEKAVFDKSTKRIMQGYSFIDNKLDHNYVVNKYGNLLDFYGEYQNNNWKFVLKDDKQTRERFTTESDLSVEDSKLVVGSLDAILDAQTISELERVQGNYYYNGRKFIGIPDMTNVINGKFYEELVRIALEKSKDQYFYYQNNAKKVIDKEVIEGSSNYNDYYTYDNRLFVKDRDKNRFYEVNGREILSDQSFKYVIQNLGNNKFKMYEDRDIFSILSSARLKIKFPGFKTGRDIVYTLKTVAELSYIDPVTEEKVNVFNTEDGTKEVVKKFTLKPKNLEPESFRKIAPSEFSSYRLDYQLFNLLFRSEDDRSRDIFLLNLLTKEDLTEKEENVRNFILKEYQRVYGNQLVVVDNQIMQKRPNGEILPVGRNLVWKLYISTKDPEGYPADEEDQLAFVDTSLDNRLVYEKIIFNDFKDLFDKAKQEQAEKFKGDSLLFSIEDLDIINFGVSPFYTINNFVGVSKAILKGKDIRDAIGRTNQEATLNVVLNNENYPVIIRRNSKLGQIEILVKNIYFDKDGKSPIQIAFEAERRLLSDKISNAQDLEDVIAIISDHFKDTPCEKELKDIIETNREEIEKNPSSFDRFKRILLGSIENMSIDDHDSDTYLKDRRFNAIRIKLNKGTKVGGVFKPEEIEKVIYLTSVIAPNVDIPFTDEFGSQLTNYHLYFNREIREILLSE